MRDRIRGFTLIELVIVMVVIGILAAIVVPKFNKINQRAYISTVLSDLRILVNQQEHYQSENQVYADEVSLLTDLLPSEGVNISINEVNGGVGWAATAFHDGIPGKICGIYYGTASADNAGPATTGGVATCPD